MALPEFDVWTAPDDAVQALYPETQQLVARLRRRQWYYRVVAYLPVLGWGTLFLYALFVNGLRPDSFYWPDAIFMLLVATFMGYTAYCLLAPGLWRRIVGYFLSAVVALLGGLGSCLLGSLLAIGAQSGPNASGLLTGFYLLAGVMGACLSLLAMIHIVLLMIVSVRLRALTGLHTLRALHAVRGDIAAEVKAAWTKVRPGARAATDPNALPSPPPPLEPAPAAPSAAPVPGPAPESASPSPPAPADGEPPPPPPPPPPPVSPPP